VNLTSAYKKLVNERIQATMQAMAAGVDQDRYQRLVGHYAGLKEALEILETLLESEDDY
jgi:hypothetical protein